MTEMETNCQSGDLARIVVAPYPCAENMRGMIVRVLQPRIVWGKTLRSARILLPDNDRWVDERLVYWTYEGDQLHCESKEHATHCPFLDDRILKPIRGGARCDDIIRQFDAGKPVTKLVDAAGNVYIWKS